MTVPTNDNREQYQGNDSATVFPYAFRIFESSDLKVYLTDSENNQALLAEGTDYTVSGAGDEDGGEVTYPVSGDPLAAGETLTILRVIDITQGTDLRNQGAYYPEVVEDEFDRSRMIDQQQQEEIDRSLRQPAASEGYDAGGYRIENIADAEEDQDAVSKSQMDERFSNDVITQTSGHWDAKGKRLGNLSAPVADTDAATRGFSEGYTDAKVEAEKDRNTAALANEAQIRADADSAEAQIRATADANEAQTRAEADANEAQIRATADANEVQARAEGDANLQAQLTGNIPLEASAFSPISWHDQSVGNSVTIPAGKNAWSFGPAINVSPSATVTVGEGSFWTVANGEVQ